MRCQTRPTRYFWASTGSSLLIWSASCPRWAQAARFCFASGFSEASAEDENAADLQAQLLAVAGDMPILGPNCYGFINYLDGALLWPDQQGGRSVDSGVAIVTQSSNIAINLTMQTRGLPISYMITAGNQAQIGIAEIGCGLLEDPRVTALDFTSKVLVTCAPLKNLRHLPKRKASQLSRSKSVNPNRLRRRRFRTRRLLQEGMRVLRHC